MLRVLASPEWENPYEHLTTDARSRSAHIANRVLFGDNPPPPYLQVNRLPFPHMIHPCRPVRDMRVGAPFDSNAQVWTAITQPRPKTNLIARSLKMKQGQDEWGRDGPYSRPFQFQRICPRGYRHIANQKSNFFGWQSAFCRQRSHQRIDLTHRGT